MKAIRLPSAIAIALLSLFTAFVISKYRLVYSIYANAPTRLQHINNIKDIEIKFADQVRNCEDVILDEDHGFALLSCDPGRDTWNTVMGTFISPKAPPETGIYLWNYTDPVSTPSKIKLKWNNSPSEFHPLGIDYHPTTNDTSGTGASGTLFVVNHAASGSRIDLFRLFPAFESPKATHIGTLRHPLIWTPNAIHAVSDKELYVTNDHHTQRRYSPILSRLERVLGIPGGSVIYVDLRDPFDIKATSLARLAFANGVVRLNDSTLAVASSTGMQIQLYSISRPDDKASSPQLNPTATIKVPFHPDNLSVDKDAKLLIAGHPHAFHFERIARNSARCNAPGVADMEGCDLRGLSWIAEWSEQDGLRDLFVGDEFGTSSTAARDVGRGLGVGSGLYEKGVLTWKM